MISKGLINKCRKKLVEMKSNLLNQAREARSEMISLRGHGGDEADQTVRLMEEKDFLNRNRRIHLQLTEVEKALARIEQGCYGLCKETGDHIEPERLMALPWTSLSIEGAEIQEGMDKKRYVR